MPPKIRTHTEDVNIDANCQPAPTQTMENLHPTALPSPISWKKFQAGQQLHASICLSLCTYSSTKLYRNDFIQHSICRAQGPIHSPVPNVRVSLLESWSWTSSCICFLMCFTQNLMSWLPEGLKLPRVVLPEAY